MVTQAGLSSSVAFYTVRSCLAMISWFLESRLVRYDALQIPLCTLPVTCVAAAALCKDARSRHTRLRAHQRIQCRATWRTCSPAAAAMLAVLLSFSCGTFFAPAAMLPSTFSMYCMISATTGVLNGNASVRHWLRCESELHIYASGGGAIALFCMIT